ncbi:MAG: preprotein translocase subunit SecE [Myxococcota bacterium]
MRNQRYILIGFLGTAAFLGFALRGLAVPLLARLEIVDPQIGFISGTGLLGLAIGVITFLVMNRHPVVYSFTDESITELRKVVWPGKDETIRSTTVVIVTTLFIALTLAMYDFVWARVTSTFLFTDG